FPWSLLTEVTQVSQAAPREGRQSLGCPAQPRTSRHRGTATARPAGLRTRGHDHLWWSPTGRHFPGRDPVSIGDGRSRSPLRGSPGLSPGSLLPRPPRCRGGRTGRASHYILWLLPDGAPISRVVPSRGPLVGL